MSSDYSGGKRAGRFSEPDSCAMLTDDRVSEALPVIRDNRSLIGRLPAAIIVSVCIQLGGLIWLSASVLTRVEERLSHHGDRLTRIEAAQEKLAETVSSISERLARAEENISVQNESRRTEGRTQRGQ